MSSSSLLNIGSRALAANMAGRNRTDFYKLLNRHGIEAANFKSKG